MSDNPRPAMAGTIDSGYRSASASPSTLVGFLEDVGELTEDLNRDDASRATGYFGKASEIAWLQKLGATVNKLNVNKEQQYSIPIDVSTAAMSYHLDHIQFPEPTVPLETTCLPPKPWAAHLVSIFFTSVAPSFPLLDKSLFINQFNQAFDSSRAKPPRKWRAVLNLVLAVGCRYYQLSQPVSEGDVSDRVFLARAVALNSTSVSSAQHLGLHQVQIDLLLAIYYLSSSQVNQAWQSNGRAARLAVSMGLNLADCSQIDPVSRETRARIWWSIVTLEHALSSLTGRTSCIDHQFMTVQVPLPFDEPQFPVPELAEPLENSPCRSKGNPQLTIYASNSEIDARDQWLKTIDPSQSLYFFHLVDLSVIMQAAYKAVYSPTATKGSIQTNIPFYSAKLQSWICSLQPAFAFSTANNTNNASSLGESNTCNNKNRREQVTLAIAYYSSQMSLNRPCLADLDVVEAGNTTNTPIQPRSHFEDTTAKTCVHFALALISLLPDKPDFKWAANMTLACWWLLLHSIMQALTILLIQLSIGLVPVAVGVYDGEQQQQQTSEANANPGEGAEEVREALKKALLWLHSLAERDSSSRRAFLISQRLFHVVTPSQAWLDLQDESFLAAAVGAETGVRAGGAMTDREKELGFARINKGLNGFGPGSLNLPESFVNWGPDCTASESVDEDPEEVPTYLDPVLLSFNSYEF
ncbi:fungal-specific transcription factor domain-containing protein [Aspergillus pseudoustus]|uniref:Fungal-specific transcription factor domain-containing protein n=1 Tax=Aspergillus pseudoustus TaxID=1810923 RepID=A0ABR4ING1_9EURO